ncbi:Uncharacterized protein TPAR_06930 [Tolypocladium paradoxum]|uniref:Kinetoplast-associated protein KAP n=1 Tax=Tolypocladium paradoxum TaxID=94208 RepID=A0A2S4KRR4_9HYPO|nr:Uncharacterized protein TPAR_06930 [Tolypocladium paradoxum]
MSSPLTPAADASLNYSTPPTTTSKSYKQYEVVRTYTTRESSMTSGEEDSTQNSSPFVSTVNETTHVADQENVSPSKAAARHSRVISGTELSPLKILAGERSLSACSSEGMSRAGRSPRKVSPEKRFPVRISGPEETPRAVQTQAQMQQTHERMISLEEAVQENEGLKHAIEIFEDEQSAPEEDDTRDGAAAAVNIDATHVEGDEAAGPDDTMVSTFSTFSAVPNMAMLAKLGQSPTKFSSLGGIPSRARPDPSPVRTGRRPSFDEPGNTTNLLMDFTEQMRFSQKSPGKRGNLSPSRTVPNVAATPSRHFTNLIDFDIPPMPTPRSVPTVTPRELESLKSGFLSEISSLKASLSGKEAEVQSLKAAVGDAEKRVGESLEQLREEHALKEQLTAERDDWETRGREMETVLRKAKEEIVLSQREREELEQKLDESEKRREAAEMLHQEAESKMAGMRAGKDSDRSASSSSPDKPKPPGASSSREVEAAVERVARELHALYKSKHETKVAALKKSYESRWEKKVRELEARIEELADDNERLRAGRDATMTRVEPSSAVAEERKAQAVRDSAAIKELTADVQRLEAVVGTVQRDNEQLRGMLERERVEKGELVQLAEEMMSMQSFVAPQQRQQQQQHHSQQQQPEPAKTPRASIARGSGLRAPGTGLRGPHERTRSGGGLPRLGGVPRSGIMSSIEKMGNYRGRAE